MIPSFITTIDALPLTPNGKVDHKALPEPGEVIKGRSYVAPNNALESQLAQMWEELLGVTPVGIRESFFELGGHSLLAVRLMAKIQKQFGKDLPISALFNNETVEELAKVLSEGSSAWRFSPLVPIQPQGTKPRFFCVHAIGGNVNNYYLLARYLGSDQPFYGLQAPPLHEVTEEDTQIEKMAARYVEAVREVQPLGPYLLGGFSFGSFVAYEMARQFCVAGQDVSFLALLDTYSPLYWNKLPQKLDVADILVSLAWTTSREKGKHVLLSIDELRQLTFDDQLSFFLEKMRAEGLAPAEVDHELLSRFLKGYIARQRAAIEYVPQTYPGRVTVFRCKDRDLLWNRRLSEAGLDPHDSTLGWRELSSEPVSVIEIPGHHEVVCNEPYVQSLAASLSTCLEVASHLTVAY
jgi:thioesterase domain-containing protein/acyl carrier protein